MQLCDERIIKGTMVNPIKNSPMRLAAAPKKKKPVKEVDLRVKKAVRKSGPAISKKTVKTLNGSKNLPSAKAYLAAEKASSAARLIAGETRKAAVLAQKKAFLAERAHMAQQAAAARRARAAEKAKKAAERAARKAASLRRAVKFKASLERPDEKKRNKFLNKYIPNATRKKKR
ncbi:MAG: hypothetical protein JSS60_09035 [Verrucomicrobia bacterium]|nr:hypothetical protein [Verrucomicrobiota bacterium]